MRLAEARRQRGWTLREAERRTGVANAHLSQLESGTILRPTLDTLVPLAAVYGLPLDELAAVAGHDVEAIRELAGTGVRVTVIAAGEPADDTHPEPEPGAAVPGDGQWMRIAFMGHIEYTGYVTEITKNGQPAYRVDLPEKIWGGNPLAWIEHAASAWFSDRPVTEESVRRAWEAQVARAAERARQEAEWKRMQEQQAITAEAARDIEREEDEDPEGYDEDEPGGWPR